MPIDSSRDFIPLDMCVLTISDSRTAETDRSGDLLAERIASAGHRLAGRNIVADDIQAITAQAKAWLGDKNINVIIATGGTGLTERDITYEAFSALYDKEIPGFAFEFHNVSAKKIGLSAIPSRASAGLVGSVCLFSLPGSPNACRDGWDHVLRDLLDARYRPCNLVELMPRFKSG